MVGFYQDSAQLAYVCFFGCVYFEWVKADKVGRVPLDLQVKPGCVFDFYPAGKDLEPDFISQTLRGIGTLAVCELNTFDSTSVKAVFAEKGAWIWPKFGKPEVFEWYRLLYLLARSYNLFAVMQDLSDLIAAKQQTAQDAHYKRMEIAFWVGGAMIGLVALF